MIGNWSRRGGASVRNVAIRSRTAPVEYKRTRWTRPIRHTALALFVDEKNAIKNFPSNMGHRRAARLFLRASICRFERVAKGRPLALEDTYVRCVVRNLCSMFGIWVVQMTEQNFVILFFFNDNSIINRKFS